MACVITGLLGMCKGSSEEKGRPCDDGRCPGALPGPLLSAKTLQTSFGVSLSQPSSLGATARDEAQPAPGEDLDTKNLLR